MFLMPYLAFFFHQISTNVKLKLIIVILKALVSTPKEVTFATVILGGQEMVWFVQV